MEEYLTVKGDRKKVVLIKFDIGVLGEYNVGRAILRLYSVRDDKNDDDEDDEEEGEGGSHVAGGGGRRG